MTLPDPVLPQSDDVPSDWSQAIDINEWSPATCLLDLIQEDTLLSLIQEALVNNPNLQATAKRLEASAFLLSIPRSRLLPHLNAELTANRDNQSLNVWTGKRETETAQRLSLGMRWEIDLWGRLADEYYAVRYELVAQSRDYHAARHALAARVIQAWVEWVALQQILRIEEERVTVLQRIETIATARYRGGIQGLDECAVAKSRRELARADVSVQKAAWRQAQRRLAVLLGRLPQGLGWSDTPLLEVRLPVMRLPLDVLLARPDVRAALDRSKAAQRTARAADKAMLPNLTLNANVFRDGASLQDIGSAKNTWNLLGSVFQPLLSWGRLRDTARARDADFAATLFDFRAVVLQALREVEDTLDLERELAVQAEALRLALLESRKSSRFYEDRYRQGLDTVQSLLIAKEQEIAVRLRWHQVQAQRLSNRVDMALALGLGLETSEQDSGVL